MTDCALQRGARLRPDSGLGKVEDVVGGGDVLDLYVTGLDVDTIHVIDAHEPHRVCRGSEGQNLVCLF